MKRKYLMLIFISIVVVIVDQITKIMVTDRFRLGDSVEVIAGFFSLTYVRNTGAAFGMLNSWDPAYRIPFFISVPIIALVAILFVFRKVSDKDFLLSTALSLVVGGAAGNLIDRVRLNYVIDFFDFYWGVNGPHFAVFNVADAAISVGVFFLIIDIFKKDKTTGQANASDTD